MLEIRKHSDVYFGIKPISLQHRFKVEREYVATVDVPELGIEPGEALKKALSEGVATADGTHEADVPAIEGREVNVVVREGKHRMVRRYGVYLGWGLTCSINSLFAHTTSTLLAAKYDLHSSRVCKMRLCI